jgi:hypothetical protein
MQTRLHHHTRPTQTSENRQTPKCRHFPPASTPRHDRNSQPPAAQNPTQPSSHSTPRRLAATHQDETPRPTDPPDVSSEPERRSGVEPAPLPFPGQRNFTDALTARRVRLHSPQTRARPKHLGARHQRSPRRPRAGRQTRPTPPSLTHATLTPTTDHGAASQDETISNHNTHSPHRARARRHSSSSSHGTSRNRAIIHDLRDTTDSWPYPQRRRKTTPRRNKQL